jgi:hypothetical protein
MTAPQTTAAPAAPANLVEKLCAVMAQVERVPKNGHNAFFGYDYAIEADITEAVRSALARYGVMLIPSVAKAEWRDVQTKNGGAERLVTLTIHFTATDGTSKIEFDILGEGQDKSDKATYKAMTGANKYALLKLFQIPTGDDPEAEADEKPHTGSRGRQQHSPPPEPAQAPDEGLSREAAISELWGRADLKFGDDRLEAWKAAAIRVFGKKVPPPAAWTAAQLAAFTVELFGAEREPGEEG